ncbi:ATP-binding cassette sub-family G member 4-like [Nylanderia fulva]|uniref:ATP-binding cassette sub-family G member 4-like n=1 Tax=Nylanderia fulva TaxID=613905 RepID=UPI0010FBAAFC|nr:ATP-binding cassette sub-family G member 4-like [Nylanderia fulva]
MLGIDDNNKDDAINMLDHSCRIQLRESEILMGEFTREERKSQLYIEFNNLGYSVDRKGIKKTILRDVTGHFEPGKLTMIIGPSGAGKSTLLKIISGERWVNVDGTVSVNGVEQNRGNFRKHVCYVPQQFELLPFLTTRETLYIAALLKMNVKRNEKENAHLIVNEITESLGLSNCLDTLANKLSGGERKRLSIGVEMITKPSVFLLDEPTSGLDSAASNQLINVLHNMAKANCIVICVIHQPSSQMISQFDDITVLDRGRCMYCGPKNKILNTYESAGFTCPRFYNISEFVLEVITEQRDGDLENLYKICRSEYEKYKSSHKHHKNEMNHETTCSKQNIEKDDVLTSENNTKQRLSTWRQQKILFLRALICIKRDTTMTMLRFAAHVVVGLLLGAVFCDFGNDAEKVNSNIACLFFLLLFLFFANSMPAVQMFPTEAAVFLQEHLNNWYSLRSYYSVKILTDLPMQILCSSSFLLISYYMTGQPMECDRILRAWSIGVLITILGQTVGILTGAAFNTEIGVFLIPALSIPLLLFAGFFLKIGEMSMYLQPLGCISFFRYAFEGIIQAIYGLDRPNLYCSEVYCYLNSPSKILSSMDMPTVSFSVILVILGCWIFCLHVIIYVVLRWKIYYARK